MCGLRERTEPLHLPIFRFFELLVQERILIIERAELDAKKKIAEIRNSNLEELKKELLKLKVGGGLMPTVFLQSNFPASEQKLKKEYNEYYGAYKEAEELEGEYQAYMKVTGSQKVKSSSKNEMTKMTAELEKEIEGYRLRYEVGKSYRISRRRGGGRECRN